LSGSGTATMQQVGVVPFLVLLVVSLAGSLVASLLYVHFYSSRATGSHVYRAFPLLGLSITAIFVCIQFSLPLSLGLLGALSIVRFRTPIKEPEEVGFIMLVIAASIATATFKLAFVGLLFGLALVALLIQTRGGPLGRQRRDGTLVVTVPDAGAATRQSAITEVVGRLVAGARLESLARHDQTVVLSYVFQDLAPEAIDSLQGALPAVASDLTYSLFFSRPGSP
ncbi:MAG: DUF4956 domain-containing protein, partial [Vicinamibacteria bacterium]|nr:DUF4956 domain-containing protein [Vicinamibacteria bacterium]